MSAISEPSRANQFFSMASQQISAYGGRTVALLPKSPLARTGTIILAFAVGLLFIRTIAKLIYNMAKARARAALIKMANKDHKALSGPMGAAFNHAFRDDIEIAKLYIPKDPLCFLVLSDRLRDSKDIALLALKASHAVAGAVGPKLKDDQYFIRTAIDVNPLSFTGLIPYSKPISKELYRSYLVTFLNSKNLDWTHINKFNLSKLIFSSHWDNKNLVVNLLEKINLLNADKQAELLPVVKSGIKSNSTLLNDPEVAKYFPA